MRYSVEEFEKKFENLPSNIKEVVSSTETPERIYNVSKNYKLHIYEMGVIEE